MFVSAGVRRDLPKLGRTLSVLYASLSEEALSKGEKMWKLSPKRHLFLNLCEWQAVEYGNPRYYRTYADEDLVGLLVEVSKTCHPATLAGSFLFK